jgi:hypothetical protein
MSYNVLTPKKTLDDILSIIERKEKGVYCRFGDGDTRIANGIRSTTHSTCYKLLQRDMKEAFARIHPNFLRTLNLSHTPEMMGDYYLPILSNKTKKGARELQLIQRLWKGELKNVYHPLALMWYVMKDKEGLAKYLYRLMLPFQHIILVGNQTTPLSILNKLTNNKARNEDFIKCLPLDAGKDIERMWKELLVLLEKYKDEYVLVLMFCGNTGRSLSNRMWKTTYNKYFVFDFGCLMDALCGFRTRKFMKTVKIHQWKLANFLYKRYKEYEK